jgi:hypothetical protein
VTRTRTSPVVIGLAGLVGVVGLVAVLAVSVPALLLFSALTSSLGWVGATAVVVAYAAVIALACVAWARVTRRLR